MFIAIKGPEGGCSVRNSSTEMMKRTFGGYIPQNVVVTVAQ